MKLIYSYILLFLGTLLFLGSFGALVTVGTSGVGVRIYIEAMRYMSSGGKVALALFGAGMLFFLMEFILAPGRE